MSTLDALQALIAQAVYGQQAANYVHTASFVLFMMDYFHTLPVEVDLIWPRKWSAIKVLYFISRYMPWVYGPFILWGVTKTDMHYTQCGPTTEASTYILITSIAVAEAIMFVRVYALSARDKKVLIWLCFQYLGVHAAIYTVLTLFVTTIKYIPSPLAGLIACVPNHTDTTKLSIVFIIIMVSEALIMALSLGLSFSRYKQSSSESKLVTVFRRDGIIYFVVLSSVTIGNIIFDFNSPREQRHMLTVLQGFLHSILSCRMILHIREVANQDFIISSRGPSTIHFKKREKVSGVAELDTEMGSRTQFGSGTMVSDRTLR